MLGAIIEDRFNNWNCLLSFNKDKRYINVLSIKDGCIYNDGNTRLNEILSLFVLGKNQKRLGIKDGYDVILDLDTGLYHYLKDGIENIEKLYTLNGENATSFSSQDKDNSCFNKLARTFKIKNLKVTFISFVAFSSIAGIGWIIGDKISDIFYNGKHQQTSIYEQYDENTAETVTAQNIKDAIYNSSNLNDAEKEYLWNEELINDVLPYYEIDLFSSYIIKYRTDNIDIVPFTEEEKQDSPDCGGYFAYDNLLHIRNYEDNLLNMNSSSGEFDYIIVMDAKGTIGNGFIRLWQMKDNIAHEFIHLLQMNTDLRMLSEAVAEIMAHEYFLESADYTYEYAYNNHSKYIKVLMEILGPDIIKERVFKRNSTCFEDAVKPYFTKDEYIEFMDIMKHSPTDLTNNQYDRLVELISILYKNKFNSDMKDNDLIQTILYSEEYNRAYFCKSLMEKSPSSYLSLREAYNNNSIDFYFEESVSEDGTHIKIDDNILNDKMKQNHAFRTFYNINYKTNHQKIKDCIFIDGTIRISCKDGRVYEEKLEKVLEFGWLVATDIDGFNEYFNNDKAKTFMPSEKSLNELKIRDYVFFDGIVCIKDLEGNCFEIDSEKAYELGYLLDTSTITYYVSYDEYLKNPRKYEFKLQGDYFSSIVYIDNITSTFDSPSKTR